MQLAQKLAGYTLGQADLMRRAMGKKKVKEMAVHEETFVNGAVAKNIPRRKAKEIFDLMAKFADYGFNRSHSMAYAVLAFQTAYLKAHYPADLYAAVLSHEADDSAKVYKYSTELRSLGLSLLPPDINESGEGFTPIDDTVRYGLTAIKGMGASSVQAIVEARRDGKFTSLVDFCSRLGTGVVNRRGLENLISAGAFDSLMPLETEVASWRARLFAAIDPALQRGQRLSEDRLRGQSGLFAAGDAELANVVDELLQVDPWPKAEIARREKTAVGFYLSAHPLDNYTELLAAAKIKNIAEHQDLQSGSILNLAGMISGVQVRVSKKGNRFATFRIEDRSGGVKGVAVGENFNRFVGLLRDDELIIAEGKIEASEGQEPTLMINEIRALDEALAERARGVSITVPSRYSTERDLEEIFGVLERERGRCGVTLDLTAGRARVRLDAAGVTVAPSRTLQRELEDRGCTVEWIH